MYCRIWFVKCDTACPAPLRNSLEATDRVRRRVLARSTRESKQSPFLESKKELKVWRTVRSHRQRNQPQPTLKLKTASKLSVTGCLPSLVYNYMWYSSRSLWGRWVSEWGLTVHITTAWLDYKLTVVDHSHRGTAAEKQPSPEKWSLKTSMPWRHGSQRLLNPCKWLCY